MSDAIKQDVLIMTGNLSLDAALALIMSQQNDIDALRAENARLREDLARMFEELPETTWTSKDVAYVIRNYTARTAIGETEC